MPGFFYYLALLFMQLVVPLIIRGAQALGIGVVSYVGINVVLEQAAQTIVASMGGASLALQQIMGLAKVDVAINIYLAAVTTRLVLSGMDKVSGTLTKMRTKTTGTLEA